MTIGLGSSLGVLGFRRRHLCSGGIIPGGGFIPVLPCSDVETRDVPPQGGEGFTGALALNFGAPILAEGGVQPVKVDVSLSAIVNPATTLQVFITLDGVPVGGPIITFAGTGAAATQAGFGVVNVPPGTHLIGVQLVASGLSVVLGGTVMATGCNLSGGGQG